MCVKEGYVGGLLNACTTVYMLVLDWVAEHTCTLGCVHLWGGSPDLEIFESQPMPVCLV